MISIILVDIVRLANVIHIQYHLILNYVTVLAANVFIHEMTLLAHRVR